MCFLLFFPQTLFQVKIASPPFPSPIDEKSGPNLFFFPPQREKSSQGFKHPSPCRETCSDQSPEAGLTAFLYWTHTSALITVDIFSGQILGLGKKGDHYLCTLVKDRTLCFLSAIVQPSPMHWNIYSEIICTAFSGTFSQESGSIQSSLYNTESIRGSREAQCRVLPQGKTWHQQWHKLHSFTSNLTSAQEWDPGFSLQISFAYADAAKSIF